MGIPTVSLHPKQAIKLITIPISDCLGSRAFGDVVNGLRLMRSLTMNFLLHTAQKVIDLGCLFDK